MPVGAQISFQFPINEDIQIVGQTLRIMHVCCTKWYFSRYKHWVAQSFRIHANIKPSFKQRRKFTTSSSRYARLFLYYPDSWLLFSGTNHSIKKATWKVAGNILVVMKIILPSAFRNLSEKAITLQVFIVCCMTMNNIDLNIFVILAICFDPMEMYVLVF